MQHTVLQKQQVKLLKWQDPTYKKQYIYFRQPVPKAILDLFQEPKSKQKKKQLKNLYQEIAGIKDVSQNYQNHVQIIQQVQTYGGIQFHGLRINKSIKNINDKYFSLRLRHLSNINFCNLIILNFYYCSLDNIQALSWLNMPKISQIRLNQNNIVSLKSISKTSFTHLNDLGLYFNLFSYHQLNQFQRCQFPQLTKISILKLDKKQISIHLQDLRLFVKLQINSGQLFRELRLRIICNNQQKSLQQSKWKHLVKEQLCFILEKR